MTDASNSTSGAAEAAPESGERSAGNAVSEPVTWQPGTVGHMVTAAVFVLLGLGYGYLALNLGLEQRGQPGPGFFPLMVAGIIVVVGFIEMIRKLMELPGAKRVRGTGRVSVEVWSILGAIGFYTAAAPLVGHVIASALLAAGIIVILGKRSIWQIVLIAVLSSLGSDLLFTLLLDVRLPLGIFNIGWSAWI